MSKILTVFGATGRQGGSVIEHILSHPGLSTLYRVRAVTRDASKASASGLKDKGVEVVSADLNDKTSVIQAVKGSAVVFGVTNFWESMDKDVEVQQGKNIVDAAKQAGVDRLVFSSLINVSKVTNGQITSVKHFDGKAEVEAYARSVGVPGTYFMPSIFAIFFLGFFRKNPEGVYTLSLPVPGHTKLPLLDIQSDAGLYVAAILLQLDKTLDRRVVASSGLVTPDEAVRIFTEVTGQEAEYVQAPWDIWAGRLPPRAKEEMVGNWKLNQSPGYFAGEPEDAIEQGKELVAKAGLKAPVTWGEFVGREFKA